MTDTTAPQRAGLFRLVAIALSLAFFVSPYLFQFGAPQEAGKDPVVGAELVGDGMYVVTRNETLVGIQNGTAGLTDTLTAPWWDASRADQALWRPVPLFFLGVASSLTGEPYNPDDPGDAPLPFHLIVLAFHVLATMLLFDLALELSKSDKVAFIAAALFATLPVHSEAIYDIAGLAELCAAAFSFGAWKLWLQAGPKPLEKPGLLAGSLALVALAALSKESAFALPLVFFLVDAGRGEAKGLDFKAAFAKLPGLIAMGVVLAVILGARISLVGLPEYSVAQQLDNPLLGVPALDRVMNAARLMVTGIMVMFGVNPLRGDGGLSYGFSADYSASQVAVLGAFSMWNLVGLLVLLGSILAAFALAKRCGTRAGLWLGMLAAMLVTSNLFMPIGTIFAERLYYFPSALLVLIVAMTLARFGKAGLGVGLVLAILGGVSTHSRADAFVTNKDYYTQLAKVDAPQSAKALYNYGTYLVVARDQASLAEQYFERAIELFPEFAAAKGRLGLAYAEALEYDKALEQLIGDLDIQLEASNYTYEQEPPNALLGPNQLLLMITELRVYNASINQPQVHLDWLDGLIAKNYQSPVVHAVRGRTLLKLGRVEEAEAAYQKSLAIEPTFGTVRFYGELLRKLGRVDDAIALYDAQAKDTEAFTPGERAEFLLRRADGELAKDPLLALKTLEEEAAAFSNDLSSEQTFQYHWTWAQAALENLPADPGGQRAQLAEIETRLKVALGAFPEANDLTYSAQYALVNVFARTGNYAELVPTAKDMLAFRPAPLLRTILAGALDQIGEHDGAQDEWRIALDELAEQESDTTTVYTTRRGLLISLSGEGAFEEALNELSGWMQGADGARDPWGLALGVDWATGWDRMDLATAWATECQEAFPDFNDVAQLFELLPQWSDPGDFVAAYSLTQQRMGWGNLEGAIEAGNLAKSLTTNPNEEALATGPIGTALNQLGRVDEAIAELEAVLKLPLDPALGAQIEGVLSQMKTAKRN